MTRFELDTRILAGVVAILLGVGLALLFSGCALALLPDDCAKTCRPRNVAEYTAEISRARCVCDDRLELEFRPQKDQTLYCGGK